jgi:PBP1b-binding outer membrane lipoprotein LpoB
MRKLIAPIVLVAALILTGCGGTDAMPASTTPAATEEVKPVEEAPQAPDLTGNWKQSNSQSETDFMTATIADGVISIDWKLGSEDITAA